MYLGILFQVVSLYISITLTETEFCRLKNQLLPLEKFRIHSCSLCYSNVPLSAFHTGEKLDFSASSGLLFHPNSEGPLNPLNTGSGTIRDTFLNTYYFLQWQKCCDSAWKCCQINRETFSEAETLNQTTCFATWDGLQCWEAMLPDTILEKPCPDFIYLEEKPTCPRYSRRTCWLDEDNVDDLYDHFECSHPLEFHHYQSKSLEDLKLYLPFVEAKTNQSDNGTIIASTESPPICCRTERRAMLSFEAYILDTCARCYNYMPEGFFKLNKKYRYNGQLASLTDPETNVRYPALWRNASHPIYETFTSLSEVLKWRACCIEAEKCCVSEMASTEFTGNGESCPGTWDGWQCFSETKAGSVAKVPCADHVYFKAEKPTCLKYAEKQCTDSGQWYFNKRLRKEWTSYAPCGRVNDLRLQLIFHLAMYTVSVTFLIPALVIFFIYKQLQVYRISMHKNFFASLLLNGVCSIIMKSTIMLDELDGPDGKTILDQNNVWCRLILILTKYFRMTNYMWMFSEGFYLHKLIAAAFAEQKSLILYYLIGWGFPVIPVLIYLIFRILYYNEKCWAMPADDFEWILNGPSLLSLISNLIFLFNIIRVLLTKLRATNANEPSQYRKAVRATIVLVPLFGLHFLLVIYRLQSGSCGLVEGYIYFGHVLDGLQGFFVSLAFCYFNGEIQKLLRRSFERYNVQKSVAAANERRRSTRTELFMKKI